MPIAPAAPFGEASAGARVVGPAKSPPRTRAEIALEKVLLVAAAIFFLLHFVHLKADFPNNSPWVDWAKYTDEGWYGDAAIRHYQLGHWNVPGDFNPAAALPMLPAIELALFRVTGVSLVAARALTVSIFGLTLVCCYWLLRRWPGDRGETRRRSLAPAIAVSLLSVNPFCYAFSRLAILEPPLILLMLLALLAASSAGAASVVAGDAEAAGGAASRRLNWRFAVRAVGLGLLLPLMVLTKTTGVFLFPAIFWLLWASSAYRVKPFLRAAGVACGVGIAVWGGYFLLFVRPRYLADYRYLFSANQYTGVTLATLWTILSKTVQGCVWLGDTFFVLALIAVIASVMRLCMGHLRDSPLAATLLLWIFGYAAFLTYHANLQPRYYLVLAVPLTILVADFLEPVLIGALTSRPRNAIGAGFGKGNRLFLRRLSAALLGAASIFAGVSGAVRTVSLIRHPEYTFVSAAEQVRVAVGRELAAHPSHSPLILSISGSDLSLMTGLPSICDDFGTMELEQRVARYRPGWFAAWNDVEDDKMEALAPWFRLVRVATIPAFDDPDRNVLILYRLDPLNSPGQPGRSRRRRSLAAQRRQRTKPDVQPDSALPKP